MGWVGYGRVAARDYQERDHRCRGRSAGRVGQQLSNRAGRGARRGQEEGVLLRTPGIVPENLAL